MGSNVYSRTFVINQCRTFQCTMPLSETSLCWTCFLATQQYLVNGLDLSIFCSVMFLSIAQNYSLMENTYSFEIMLNSSSLPLDPQNTRGRRRWRVSSSSPTLAAFADSVLVSASSLPSRSFTGLQSGFSPVSEEPVRQSHQHQYKEQQVNMVHFSDRELPNQTNSLRPYFAHLVSLSKSYLEKSGQFWKHPENWQSSEKIRIVLKSSGKLAVIWKIRTVLKSSGKLAVIWKILTVLKSSGKLAVILKNPDIFESIRKIGNFLEKSGQFWNHPENWQLFG